MIGIVLAAAAFGGWRAGIVKRLLELVGTIVAVVLAARYGTSVGLLIAGATDLPAPVAGAAGWIAIIALGYILSRFLAWVVSRIIGQTILGGIDRAGGAVFGLGVGVLVVSVLLVLASAVPNNDDLRREIQDQPLSRLVHSVAPALWQAVNGEDHDLDRLWDDLRDSAQDHGKEAVEAAARAAAELRDDEGR